MNQLKYRPDIDGLRAIAVMTVIAFHFNASWIPGGFIGVDIFFVISGFIITTAIYQQIRDKQFSFSVFYAKRIKRILPLFYLVAGSSLIISWYLFTPNDLVGYADSLRYSSAFISNIYFEKRSGYFAPSSETMPLLHTWSLSIEEQFYFIWPIVLILCAKYLPRKVMLWGLLLLSLVLISYSEFLSLTNSSGAYYLIQSRGFELLLGALLAITLYIKREKSISLTEFSYQVSGILGAILLLYLYVFIDKDSVFPGINAALVSIASVLIIFSGDNRKSLIYRLLSKPVLVFIGKLSYSLYLWHWPVLAFYRYYNIEFGLKGVLTCALLTFILSYLSWRFFETPLRHKVIKKRWVYLFYFIIPLILSISLAKNIDKNNGYGERFSDEALRLYEISEYTYDEEKLSLPESDFYKPFEPYLFGDNSFENKSYIKVLMWGDSHAGHFRSFVDELGKQYHFTSLFGGLGGCPPLLGSDLVKHGKPEKPCSERNNELAEVIKNSDASVVVLAGRWAMYTETTRAEGEKGSRVFLGDQSDYAENTENSRRAFEEGLDRSISFLIKHGKTPVLIGQVPAYPFKPSNCWVKKELFNWSDSISCDLKQTDVNERYRYSNQVIERLDQKYPELITILPADVLCDGTQCKSKLLDTPLYKDNNHLNSEGARKLLEMFMRAEASSEIKNMLSELR